MALNTPTRSTRDTSTTGLQDSTAVQNVATYRTPILATVHNQVVRIVALGDLPGSSPVVQVVDDAGQMTWIEQERVTIIDLQVLPPSSTTIANAFKSLK